MFSHTALHLYLLKTISWSMYASINCSHYFKKKSLLCTDTALKANKEREEKKKRLSPALVKSSPAVRYNKKFIGATKVK